MKIILLALWFNMSFLSILHPGLSPVTPQEQPESASVGEELLFTLLDYDSDPSYSGDETYDWDFGDHLTENAAGNCTVHTYQNPGNYTVTLTIVDGETTDVYTTDIIITGEIFQAPVYSSPLLELKFEDSLNDSSGNSRNASGTSPVYETKGAENKCLDVRNNHATVNGYFLNGLSAFTISFWYRVEEADTYGYMLHKETSGGTNELRCYIASAFIRFQINIGGTLQSAETYLGGSYDVNTDMWHHVVATYDGSYLRLYVDNDEVLGSSSPPVACSGNVVVTDTDLNIGREIDGSNFPGYIDELKIYNVALTQEESFIGFELWHADFIGRYSQYIYAQIPEAYRSYRLLITIVGNSYAETSLFDQTGSLSAEEVITFNNYIYDADTYTITAKILNGETEVETVTRTWIKTFDGVPTFGIDKNNAYRDSGSLFFPVLPWIVDLDKISGWSGRINALYGTGFYDDYTEYLAGSDYKVIFPVGGGGRTYAIRNADLSYFIDNTNSYKSNSKVAIWSWVDEPTLGSESTDVPSTVVRAWTRITKENDPSRAVHVNLPGKSYARIIEYAGDTWEYRIQKRHEWTFLHNKRKFGKNTLPVDSLSQDYYPIEWANPYTDDNATMERFVRLMDNYLIENHNLVPLASFVETTDIYESPYSTKWYPTVAQIKMMVWASIIHGCNAICWFPYRTTTPDENWIALSDTKTLIEYFATVLLSDPSSYSVSISEDVSGLSAWDSETSYVRDDEVTYNGYAYICIQACTGQEPYEKTDACGAYWKLSRRVDAKVYEDDTYIYVFAIRLTEIDNVSEAATLHVDDVLIEDTSYLENAIAVSIGPDALSVQLTLSDTLSRTVAVYDESRNVTMTSGIFTDTFDKNELHIYMIPKAE